MASAGPVHADGSINEAAVELLHTVCKVDRTLLRSARIRPSRANWLHAPWYPYHWGGAITLGRRIWFSRIWFAPDGHGDGSLDSCRKWLLLLAHESGHLPQAERFGRSFFGKLRYVAAFMFGYAARAMRLKRDVHDIRLEREADQGRAVLMKLLDATNGGGTLVAAVQRDDVADVRGWCGRHQSAIAGLREEYHREHLA